MASLVRHSKFKHVYCDQPRPDATFQGFRLSTVTGDQSYIKANQKFFAVPLAGGGGPFAIIPHDKPGRIPIDLPHFSGHTAPVTDLEFSLFDNYLVASGSEDTTIKLWQIPEQDYDSVAYLKETIKTPLVDLTGHSKKILFIKFHPTVSNILASASGDQSVKLWDIASGTELNSNNNYDSLIQDLIWDYEGTCYITSAKDRSIRVSDSRLATHSLIIPNAHSGSKCVKLTNLGNTNRFLSTGFTKESLRVMKIWDLRNLKQPTSEVPVDEPAEDPTEEKKVTPVHRYELDHAAGVIMPFFDPDTNVLYLTGKGDGNVRVFEVSSEADQVFPLTDFRSSVSAKGMAFVPKRGLNILNNETARLLKLTTNSVEPLSFYVPRKSEGFQEDLYPDSFAQIPSNTLDDWISGTKLKEPTLASMDPAVSSKVTADAKSAHNSMARSSIKSIPVLMAELEKANLRIKELEDKLAEAGIPF